MFKRLLVALAIVAAPMVPAPQADAGAYYLSVLDCDSTSAHGNRVCIDISAQWIGVYSAANTVYAWSWVNGPDIATSHPTQGWLAYDNECSATTHSSFVTGSGGGLGSNTVTIFGGATQNHWWNHNPVPQSFSDIVAWMVNSATGYECIIVP